MTTNAISGCQGKHPFDSQSLAKQVARQASRRHEVKMGAYECRHCGRWHIGERSQFQKPKKIQGERND